MTQAIDELNPSISVVVPTFRPGSKEFLALQQLVTLSTTISAIHQIIVVNDSDTALPGNYLSLFSEHPSLVNLIEYGVNRGRAHARNAGAHAATSDVLWFLDSDCYCNHAEAQLLCKFDWINYQVHYGQIINTHSNYFWSRYQQSRRQSVNTNSSANLLLQKSAFEKVGGYCEKYVSYGFEDRDLYERLVAMSSIQSHQDFFVEHDGNVDFNSTRTKVFESAASGRVFASRYPERYLQTVYATVDADYCKPFIYFLLNAASAIERSLHPVIKFSVESLPLPFKLKSLIVKVSFACTYFRATKNV